MKTHNNMVLNLKGIPNVLFDNSQKEEIGLPYGERNISTAAVKSFIVGGASQQYDCTTSFAEVTGMSVEHESRTGKVLITYSCTSSPGVSELISMKLQKDGVDVEGTQQETHVSAAPGTTYWNCPPCAFQTTFPDVDAITINDSNLTCRTNDISLHAPVFLPHGAVVTAVTVYGNAAATAETYTLEKIDYADGASTVMGGASIGTADTSITNATIDNENYFYVLDTSSLDTNDAIFGARITYTPSPFTFQGEGPSIPATITFIETAAEKNTWRIMAKTSQDTPDDSFINDRILSVMDI
ncbi:MAG TPA: hypothetical protein ENI23_13750 [bacterium]|nr:hypothetical protein [bacterium]